ncbi:MAG: hypothetical protein C0432_00300 [Candidatus Puniceispirillum sp.]|nr:hypothetical protein [Candidatus Pelagibacter sp.]MBA4282723.1 hypothetical protein [Candidatus Puniceispirillum sp.]
MIKKSVYLLVLSAFLISQVFSSSPYRQQFCQGELCEAFRALNSADGDMNFYGSKRNGATNRYHGEQRRTYGTFNDYNRGIDPSNSVLEEEYRIFLANILYNYEPIFNRILFK